MDPSPSRHGGVTPLREGERVTWRSVVQSCAARAEGAAQGGDPPTLPKQQVMTHSQSSSHSFSLDLPSTEVFLNSFIEVQHILKV